MERLRSESTENSHVYQHPARANVRFQIESSVALKMYDACYVHSVCFSLVSFFFSFLLPSSRAHVRISGFAKW